MKEKITDHFITPDQAAEYLNKSRLTIYRYIRQGGILPAVKIGGRWLIDAEKLREKLNQTAVK